MQNLQESSRTFDRIEKLFEERYANFVKDKNNFPSITDCVCFGFGYEATRAYLDIWEKDGKAKIIKDGQKKRVVWKGYENCAKVPHNEKLIF